MVPGFPKFMSGWVLWGPSVGDLLGNGHNDLVALTREGYLYAWRTPGHPGGGDQWWGHRHDERNTGRWGTDTRPPDAIRRAVLSAGGRRLRFIAPGGDWYDGRAKLYRVTMVRLVRGGHGRRRRSKVTRTTIPVHGPAGTLERIRLPVAALRVRVQAVDGAGNLAVPVTVSRTRPRPDAVAIERVGRQRIAARTSARAIRPRPPRPAFPRARRPRPRPGSGRASAWIPAAPRRPEPPGLRRRPAPTARRLRPGPESGA